MQPKCILLDIEGTTSSISFVYDVMFPYVRKNLDSFLAENWNDECVVDCLPLIAEDCGKQLEQWLPTDENAAQKVVAESIIQFMDDDVKATGLKKMQGLIWKSGFESGLIALVIVELFSKCIELVSVLAEKIRITLTQTNARVVIAFEQ